MFQASHCLGLSWKACKRFPQTDVLGPPESVSEGASVSIWLRRSKRLVMHPVFGSTLIWMYAFLSVSLEAWTTRTLPFITFGEMPVFAAERPENARTK